MRNALIAGGMASLALATAAAAQPAGQAGYSLELRGHVPVICRVSLNQTQAAAAEGVQPLGAMTEFCNSAGGYQVWIDHQPGAEGAVWVDGRRVALSNSGSTLISHSATAARRSRNLQLELQTSAAAPASLSLRVVPL